MKYILTVLGTTALVVGFSATLNFAIDPAGIFRKNSFGQKYAEALMESKYGLVFPASLDEREFKIELAKRASQYDCVVIGSSHVMQVGSARKHRSFPACRSILNLGVSGAGIEDHVVLAWLALSDGKPRMLIFGVDPWTFAFEKDDRWKVRYAEQYHLARMEIHQANVVDSSTSSRWSSLISAQYTRRSLDHLLRGAVTPSINVVQSVDEDEGGKFSITLQDGSQIYSSDYIRTAKNAPVPVGGEGYKTAGVVNDGRAVTAYQRLMGWVTAHGVKPVLLMTPYHPNVWMLESSRDFKAMQSTEKIVREMGNELAIPVVGSFRPDILGCAPTEFFDFMHPTASCVARFTAQAAY